MANQLKMAIVQSILHLHALNWSQRRIARELGIDRETVRRHLSAPQFLAALRNAAIGLLRSLGVTNIAEALRENACRVDDTLSKLGIPNL